MNMYDYRSTKKRVSRAPLRGGVLNSHRRKRQLPIKKHRSVSPSFSMNGLVSSLLIWLVGGVVVAGLSVYVALKFILPGLFPLETLQTVLLLPGQANPQQATVVLFNPEAPNITLVHLKGEAVPDLAGNLSLAQVNQKMGKLMDQVVILPTAESITQPTELKNFLWQQMMSKSFGFSRGEKLKLWLFMQSLPSTKVTTREVATAFAWQQYVQNTAKQISLNACSIALINTTKTAGLGKNMSQLLEQSGYQVIKVDSQLSSLEISEVHVAEANGECWAYAQRISESLIGQPVLKQDPQQPQLYRAEIVIFLGEDMGALPETATD